MKDTIENNITSSQTSPTKKVRIAYYISTGLISLVMIISIGNYFFNNTFMKEEFIKLGYPTYIIYPLAISKLIGLVFIWTRKTNILTNLAYSGFFYVFVLGFFAHVMISDNEQWFALASIIVLSISYFSSEKTFERVQLN